MAPNLEHVFSMHGYMGPITLDLGPIKKGPSRSITALTGGKIVGVPGSRGKGVDIDLVPGGSDWLTFDPETNLAHLDVRTQGRSREGDCFFVFYHGVLQMDETALKFLDPHGPEVTTTKGGNHYWFSAPRMETSSKYYSSTICSLSSCPLRRAEFRSI